MTSRGRITPACALAATLAFPALRLCGSDVVVDPEGRGKFPTIGAAIEAATPSPDGRVRIFVQPGTYRERLTIDKPRISLIGLGSRPDETVIIFDLHARSRRPDAEGTVGTTGSSSVFVHGDDFAAVNLTIANGTPDGIAQAVALKTTANRLVFDRCHFNGYQDTLYPTGGRQYFHECRIEGDVDFIFGNATAVFERCTVVSMGAGYVTAANTRPDTPLGFVFLDCTLAAAPNVADGSVYLGRPWQWDRGPRASVTFVRTRMGPHIAAAGWHPWHVERNTAPGETSRFAEFSSTDLEGRPIDVSNRVPWARQLDPAQAAELITTRILAGPEGWDPSNVVAAERAALAAARRR
jgi:pectinesterase